MDDKIADWIFIIISMWIKGRLVCVDAYSIRSFSPKFPGLNGSRNQAGDAVCRCGMRGARDVL